MNGPHVIYSVGGPWLVDQIHWGVPWRRTVGVPREAFRTVHCQLSVTPPSFCWCLGSGLARRSDSTGAWRAGFFDGSESQQQHANWQVFANILDEWVKWGRSRC